MLKKKLELRKKTIASLTDAEQGQIVGGNAYTTSHSDCTHFACCGDTCAETYTQNPVGCPGYSENETACCETTQCEAEATDWC